MAGFEKHERNAVITQQWTEFISGDGFVSTSFELADILGIFKTQSPKTDRAVINSMTIKVDDVIRLLPFAGTIEF